MSVLQLLLSVLIVGLFLYSKLLPYKDRLKPGNRKVFDFFQSLFEPVLKLLRLKIKPYEVGQGLFVDVTQLILLLILLLIINILK